MLSSTMNAYSSKLFYSDKLCQKYNKICLSEIHPIHVNSFNCYPHSIIIQINSFFLQILKIDIPNFKSVWSQISKVFDLLWLQFCASLTCTKMFNSKKIMEPHFKTVRIRFHYCSFCKIQFPSKQALSEHWKSCDGYKFGGFGCEKCNEKFSCKDYLKDHYMAFHPKELLCSKCNILPF